MKQKTIKSKKRRSVRDRTDWEMNHSRIRDAMLTLIDRNRGTIPSQDEIAKECKLSRPTVQRHLKEMELTDIAKPFRALADAVLLGLANKAVRGDTNAAKLYFKLTFGENASGDLKGE
jgi:AraC-like DNA-binding protein